MYGISLNDLVVLPRQQADGLVAVGKMVADYEYRSDCKSIGLTGPHTRKVKWRAVDIPRANFEKDLQNSLNAQRTIFQMNVCNAEERINKLVNNHLNEKADCVVEQIRGELPEYPDYMIVSVLGRAINRLSD